MRAWKSRIGRCDNMAWLTNSEFLELIRICEIEIVLNIASALRKRNNAVKIIEIGAGAGWQARQLSEAGYEVEAIDLEQGYYSNDRVWPVRDYDGKHIPFADDSFDIVFSSSALEHIPHLTHFQNEMKRVLKPNGIAIHIVPSGSWRLWTNLTHYPYVFGRVLDVMRTPRHNGHGEAQGHAGEQKRRSRRSGLIMKALFPTRHGERGTALSELYEFSRFKWSAVFMRSGWKIERVIPNRLFYTGYLVFGSYLSISLRKYVSYVLGSSCHVFVLKKANLFDDMTELFGPVKRSLSPCSVLGRSRRRKIPHAITDLNRRRIRLPY